MACPEGAGASASGQTAPGRLLERAPEEIAAARAAFPDVRILHVEERPERNAIQFLRRNLTRYAHRSYRYVCREKEDVLRSFAADDLVWSFGLKAAACIGLNGRRHRTFVDVDDLPSQMMALERPDMKGWIRRSLFRGKVRQWRMRERRLARTYAGVGVCSEADRRYLGAPPVDSRHPQRVLGPGARAVPPAERPPADRVHRQPALRTERPGDELVHPRGVAAGQSRGAGGPLAGGRHRQREGEDSRAGRRPARLPGGPRGRDRLLGDADRSDLRRRRHAHQDRRRVQPQVPGGVDPARGLRTRDRPTAASCCWPNRPRTSRPSACGSLPGPRRRSSGRRRPMPSSCGT